MPVSKPKLTNEGQISGEGSSVGAISFSPDGSLLATGNDLGILTVRFMHIFKAALLTTSNAADSAT
jgi:WD40 repeat protein